MKRHILTSILLAGSSLSAPVCAQQYDETATAQSGLGEIIVTANRREESLQEVPLAVTALNAEMLAAKGITSLESLTTMPIPGLIVIPNAGQPTTISINMRGVSTASPADGLVEQGVAIYIDGVPLGRAVGAGIELADIERIEVLRGPQGTLFGRNAEGGAVQFISKRPTGDFGGKFDAQYGNYDAVDLRGQIEMPIGDTFAVKVAGIVSDRGGFVKNKALGPNDTMDPKRHNDFGEFDQKGFRVAALWTPSDSFNAYYTYDLANTEITAGHLYRRAARGNSEPAFCSNPNFAPLCATAFVDNIYKNRPPAQKGFVKTSDLPYSLERNKTRTRGHGLTLTYAASDALTFKSITGYRSLTEHSRNNLQSIGPFVQFIPLSAFDGLGTDVVVGTLGAVSSTVPEADVDQEQFSQELQVVGNADGLKFTAGIFYYYERVLDTRETLFNNQWFYRGTPGLLVPATVNPFALSPSKVTYHGRADSYAAYAQATWTVPGTGERLKLTGGLRYTNDTKKFVREFYLTGPDGLSRAQFKDSRFDPAFTIAYEVSDDINVYGRYASAYRAGGVPIRNKLALTTYGPEVNKSLELGFKSQFLDRRVRWNVAVFRSRVKGTQVSSANIIADPSSQDYLNIPETVKIWGIESEITAALVAGLTVGINYAYLNVDGPPTVPTARGPLPFIPPNSPKHTFTLTADYETPLSGEMMVKAHVNYNYISGYTLSPLQQANTQVTNISLHSTNARLGVDDIPLGGDASLYVGVFGRNIFNVADDAFTFATGTSDPTASGGFAYAVDPRTYGIEARVRF